MSIQSIYEYCHGRRRKPKRKILSTVAATPRIGAPSAHILRIVAGFLYQFMFLSPAAVQFGNSRAQATHIRFPVKRIARGGDLKGNAAFAHDSTDKDIDGRGRRHAELGAYGVKLLLEFRIHTDIECRLYHNSLILSFFLCTLSAEKIFPGQEQNAFCSGKALSRNGLPRSPVSAGAYDIAGGALLFVVQSAVQARQRRQQALVYGAQALQVPHQCLLPLP